VCQLALDQPVGLYECRDRLEDLQYQVGVRALGELIDACRKGHARDLATDRGRFAHSLDERVHQGRNIELQPNIGIGLLFVLLLLLL